MGLGACRWGRRMPARDGGPTIGGMDGALRQRAAVVALLRLPAVSWSQAAATVLERGEATSVLSEQLGEDDALFSLGAGAQARIETAAAEISTWEAEGIDSGVRGAFGATEQHILKMHVV
jgi:DNA processing protein